MDRRTEPNFIKIKDTKRTDGRRRENIMKDDSISSPSGCCIHFKKLNILVIG